MAETTKPKRRLRPPKTVREKAAASKQASTPKPKKRGKLTKAIAWPIQKVASPFRKTAKFLNKFRAIRWIVKFAKFLAKILLISYIASSWQELKNVTWPKWRESRRLTIAVLAFAIFFGAAVAILDYGLSHLFRIILLSKKS